MKKIIFSFYKTLFTVIITLILLIIFKSNQRFKKFFYSKIYENTISFAKINILYQKHFGSILPFNINNIEPVFNEKLIYNSKEKYKDGVKLSVNDNYLVPVLNDGVVIYIGEKEDYGKVIIVNQSDGIDVWYGNMDNVNVSLYDYVKKGKYIGNVKNNLYLVYKKNGKILDYDKYI